MSKVAYDRAMLNTPSNKAELRKVMPIARSALARKFGPIREKLLQRWEEAGPQIRSADIVSGFFPMGDEADSLALLEALAMKGHATALPVTPRGRAPLVFHRWSPGDPLVPARFGLSEPPETAPVVEPDVLLVPLLAFDATGHRLGYGAGYYDRTLAALRAKKKVLAVGVAYAGQEVDEVFAAPHDQKLDWVVTEREARRFP